MRVGGAAKISLQAPVLPIPPHVNDSRTQHGPNRRQPTARHRTLSWSRVNSRCCAVCPLSPILTIGSLLAGQVMDLREEQTASKEAAASLEDANKTLQGHFLGLLCRSQLITTACHRKAHGTPVQTRHSVCSSRHSEEKQDLSPRRQRVDLAKWNEVGEQQREVQPNYRLYFLFPNRRQTQLTCILAEIEEPEERGRFQGRRPVRRTVKRENCEVFSTGM